MLQPIRIFARLPDGSIRRAVRPHDRPEWSWVNDGEAATRRLGDIVVTLTPPLPANATEFIARVVAP
jgi:hypothetical protein